MLIKPGTFRIKRSLTNQIARLFANGQDGFWYDPLIQYLYTTSTGVTSVSAAEDPIGLMIDRRFGAGLGSELVTNGTFDTVTTGWSAVNSTLSIVSGVMRITPTAANGQARATITTVIGKSYKISATLLNVNGSAVTHRFLIGTSAGTGDLFSNDFGAIPATVNAVFTATGTTTHVGLYSLEGVLYHDWDNISIKLIDGNHSIQATAAARPTYRVDAGGLPYIASLGTDDNMTCVTGGGGTTGFYLGCAIVVAGGAGTAREIYSDSGANTGIHVEIDAANKLSMSAGNGVAFTTLASTATVDVGTKYILEAYIIGGVMYLQINGAAAESVAAPTITAGSAGFTLFKDNLLASDFMIGNIYSVIYAKNTGLTESQRGINRSYLRSRIGL